MYNGYDGSEYKESFVFVKKANTSIHNTLFHQFSYFCVPMWNHRLDFDFGIMYYYVLGKHSLRRSRPQSGLAKANFTLECSQFENQPPAFNNFMSKENAWS